MSSGGSFGGAIKLRGADQYKRELSSINQELKKVSSEMKVTAATFDKNDNSTQALTARLKDLNNLLQAQASKVKTLESSLEDWRNKVAKQQSAHEALEAKLKDERAALERIGATLGTSSNEYKAQEKVVADLEKEVQKSSKAMESNERSISNVEIELNKAKAQYTLTEKAVDQLGKELDETSDDAEDMGDALKDTASAADKASDGFTVFKGVVANLASQAIAKAVEGLKKMGTALVETGKQAISSYAEYEQLVGGVETLFKDSAGIVMKYAENAYKTAGLSANQYMETVTSFSASLLQGLGGDTAKAAKIADLAVTDMADNANKMGTSIELIQNAYQGFAKDNFTMLDNLKLGYGGTAGEMARLVNETGVMGTAFKATAQNVKDIPFDKMIEAIHKVQENMGITGTTALEASDTIQGSVNSMKSAWKNFLTSMASGNGDMKASLDKFIDSALTVSKNVIPRIKEVAESFKKLASSLINEILPKLKKEFPGLAIIIEPLEWIIKNRQLVISAISGMLAAFAVSKILTFAQSIASMVTTFTTAIKTAGSLSAAMAALNGTMLANPIILVAAAVAGLGVALVTLISNTNDTKKAIAETTQELDKLEAKVDANADSWDELRKAQQESYSKGMSEISYYEDLADELGRIVDENGKVKDGYEARAGFITSTLKEALGVEIGMQNGVIQGYQNIRDQIDKTIEKKKAEILLNSQEALYTEAIQNRSTALAELSNIENQLVQLKADNTRAWEIMNAASGTYSREEIEWAKQRIAVYQTEYDELLSSKQKQQATLGQYYAAIGLYEQNAALFHSNNYSAMQEMDWQYLSEYAQTEEEKQRIIAEGIAAEQSGLDILKKMRTDANAEMIDSQIAAANKRIAEGQRELLQFNKVTADGLSTTEILWADNLDDILSEITGSEIQFEEAGDGTITSYVDGIKQDSGLPKSTITALVTDAILAIAAKQPDADAAGQNLIYGVNNGVRNRNAQSSVFGSVWEFGKSLLANLKGSMKEQSPSKATKEMGIFLLEGLEIGIDKEENTVLSQVKDFGSNVIDTLNGSLQEGVSGNALEGIRNAIPSEFNANLSANTSQLAEATRTRNTSLVGQFMTALSNMKIEMDDREFGKFVDKTMTNVMYN